MDAQAELEKAMKIYGINLLSQVEELITNLIALDGPMPEDLKGKDPEMLCRAMCDITKTMSITVIQSLKDRLQSSLE